MLDMGFEKDIKKITGRVDFPQKPSNTTMAPETSWQKSTLNPNNKRKQQEAKTERQMQTVMFSATFPKEIRRLASEFLDNYVFLRIGNSGATVATIQQSFIPLEQQEDKEEIIVDELRKISGLTVVFVATKKKRGGAFLVFE